MPTEQESIEILWKYNQLGHTLQSADCILVLGSHDTRVAEYAAKVFSQELAPLIVFSGGFGRSPEQWFDRPEAEVFASIAQTAGVPEGAILLEPEASNTGENIQFSLALLNSDGRACDSFILVQKPYMERRTFATFKRWAPEKTCVVTSTGQQFEEYIDGQPEGFRETVINEMVGDTQRCWVYAEKGFQIEQPVPDEVRSAFEYLMSLGYDKHVIR